MGIFLGIDIGGTSTKFGIVSSEGKILSQSRIATRGHAGIEAFVRSLSEALRALLKETGHEGSLQAIGVGAPNGNYLTGNIEHAPNLEWKGIVPLSQMLAQEFKVPVKLTNDANAAAMGEMIFGGAKGMKDFILITLGTGLGSGIVIDGKVLYGKTGMAGELGHVIVEPGGRSCGCGRKGCLETYVSSTGLVRTMKEKQGSTSTTSEITSHGIGEAALRGDAVALACFQETGERLGLALANAVAFSSPEAIFLFGGLAQSKDLILKPTLEAFQKNVHLIYRETVKILLSDLNESDAAILGAASLVV